MTSHEAVDKVVGRVIAGKYAIESYLGGGAMGSVYRARQFALDRTVAIKLMRPDLASDRSFVGRFHREAKAASRLAHPHSIGVSDFGEEADGLLYIVMEYVAGRDLERVMQEDGLPLADGRIVDILAQVLSAVAVAHDQGIVHRDLKPENILIVEASDDEGNAIEHVKVCDFGIASMRGAAEPELPASPDAPFSGRRDSGRKLTAIGTLLGTPAYMSPEQAAGNPLDAASDIYSIGAILFELLTGRTVYDADTPEQMVLRQMTGTPEHPREVRACDEQLAEICMRALSRKAADRHPSARALRAELRAAAGRLPERSFRGRMSSTPELEMPVSSLSTNSALVRSLSSPSPAASAPLDLPGSVRGPNLPCPPLARTTHETRISTDSLPPRAKEASDSFREGATSPGQRRKASTRRWLAMALVLGASAVGIGGTLAYRNKVTSAPPAAPALRGEVKAAVTPASSALPSLAGSGEPIELMDDDPNGALAASAVGARPAVGAARASNRPAAAPSSDSLASTGGPGPRKGVPGAELAIVPPTTAAAAPPFEDLARAAPAAPTSAPSSTRAPPPPDEATAPSLAAIAPFTPDRARVNASVVGASRTSRSSIASVVSHVSFDSCYREALRGLGRAEGGTGTAHLDIDEDGIVRSAQVRLPVAVGGAAECFAAKLRGQRVSAPDTGAATADLSFALVPN